MSQTSKIILTTIISALLAGGSVYLWQNDKNNTESLPAPNQKEKLNEPKTTAKDVMSNEWEELIKRNCEFSDGSFSNGSCKCPIEESLGQTQELMYDKNTGYCQTTHGGPGGDAFAASVGLPWGDFSFWIKIVGNNCTETGGLWGSTARCTCPDKMTYDKSTGYCK